MPYREIVGIGQIKKGRAHCLFKDECLVFYNARYFRIIKSTDILVILCISCHSPRASSGIL